MVGSRIGKREVLWIEVLERGFGRDGVRVGFC